MLSDAELISNIQSWLYSRRKKKGLNICLLGAEGSGKTTLSQQLVTIINETGFIGRRIHVFAFYKNIFMVPILLLINRYISKQVLIYDRSIYDNLAMFLINSSKKKWFISIFLYVVRHFYPKYDCYIFLQSSPDIILKRRPGLSIDRVQRMSMIYLEIAKTSGFSFFYSKPTVLYEVLSLLKRIP